MVPDGRGKTEAYLGLIALTIIRRRRKFEEMGAGTAVMMRYTLRLLTTQQFQRATLLIMAMELIRRWDIYALGKEPIYIGLFVGNNSLPNKLDGLKEEFTKTHRSPERRKLGRSRIPLRKCPWCGRELNPIQFYEGGSSDPYSFNRIFLCVVREWNQFVHSRCRTHYLPAWPEKIRDPSLSVFVTKRFTNTRPHFCSARSISSLS